MLMPTLRTVSVFLIACGTASSGQVQETIDRGTFVARRGTDTLAVERFSRTADTLRGSLRVYGEPRRLDYVAILGPNNTVRSLLVAVFEVGGGAPEALLQRARAAVLGDTVVVQRSTGVTRIATAPNAVPMFAFGFALMEVFTRRARANGGSVNVPFVPISGRGMSLDVPVRAIGTDSLVVTIQGAATRFRIDAIGRILGGTDGENTLIVRLGPESAAGVINSLKDTTVTPTTVNRRKHNS